MAAMVDIAYHTCTAGHAATQPHHKNTQCVLFKPQRLAWMWWGHTRDDACNNACKGCNCKEAADSTHSKTGHVSLPQSR